MGHNADLLLFPLFTAATFVSLKELVALLFLFFRYKHDVGTNSTSACLFAAALLHRTNMLLVFCILTLSYQFLMELNNQYLLTHCCKKHQRSEGKWPFQALLAAVWEKIMIIFLNAFTRVHFCWKEINWVIRFFISCRHMSFTVHTGFFSAEGCLLFGWQTLRLQCHRQRLGLYQQHLNIRFQWIQWKLGCMNIHIYRERDECMDRLMGKWQAQTDRQTDRTVNQAHPNYWQLFLFFFGVFALHLQHQQLQL